MDNRKHQEVILKAKIEIGSAPIYTMRNGGLGMTLWIDVGENEELAKKLRKKTPSIFYGFRTLVVHSSPRSANENLTH
tara:strand:- start:685 stop:918 length:234 start_codon:yes stop_codon:yes gene_type:complete